MPTTSRGLRYPTLGDTPDVPRDLKNLADDVNAMWISSTTALRPVYGIVGREHYSTDTGVVSLDIGTAWVIKHSPHDGSSIDISPGGALIVKDLGVSTAKLAANAVTGAKIANATISDSQIAALNKDGAAGTPCMRTLGTGASQAAAGNDPRFPLAILYFSQEYDPAAIAPGNRLVVPVSAFGVQSGDVALASFATAESVGVEISAQVYGTNQVDVILFNRTGGIVDLGNFTIKVMVIKQP